MVMHHMGAAAAGAGVAIAVEREGLRDAGRSSDEDEDEEAREEELAADTTTPFQRGIKWQWKHEERGWQDFTPIESNRIEKFLWTGCGMMRLRAGKGKRTRPREIYFWDRVQFNPKSESKREIRRMPKMRWYQHLYRWSKEAVSRFAEGDIKWYKPLTMEEMTQKRDGTMNKFQLYNVGFFGRLMFNFWWELFANFMIIFNAVWIGVDANNNLGSNVLDTEPGWIVMDNVFCVWFLLELIIRLFAFRMKRFCWMDKWFMFDFSLVILQVVETWLLASIVWLLSASHAVESNTWSNLSVLRSLRLLRVIRLTRLFKVVPQLMVLLKGITQAMQSLLYTLLLLAVLTYMFAVIFKTHADELVEDPPGSAIYRKTAFQTGYNVNSVLDAFWILLVHGVFMDDCASIILLLRSESWAWACAFLTFVFLSNLTMLNMLIGILCEVIARVTDNETKNVAKMELERNVKDLLECYDLNEDGMLRRSEFHQLMNNPDLQMVLEANDIDFQDLQKLEDVLFGDEEDELAKGVKTDPDIKWEKFLERVFRLQGGNSAKVTDVVELRGYVRKSLKRAMNGTLVDEASLKRSASDHTGQARPALTFPDKAVVARQEGGAGSPNGGGLSKFEEQVLAKLNEIQLDQNQLKNEVLGLRRRVDAMAEGGGFVPGSVPS